MGDLADIPPDPVDREPITQALSDYLGAVAGIIALAMGTATFLLMLLIDRTAYSPVPWGDMWDYWAWHVRFGHHNLILHLADQHNEHRIVVARLLFLFDQYWCHANAKSLYIFTFLVQLFHATALWLLSSRVSYLGRASRWFIAGMILTLLFSAQQFTNFVWFFQVPFVIVYLGASLACISVMGLASQAYLPRSGDFSRVGLVVLLGVITTYSMANGLLIWPVLLSLAFAIRTSRRVRLLLALSGACAWTQYLWHYKRPLQHASLSGAFLHLPKTVAFLLTTIGSPASDTVGAILSIFALGKPETAQFFSALVGLFGLVLASVVLLQFFRSRDDIGLVENVYLHILLFLLGSLLLIAMGRFSFPLTEALTSRYATPSLLFWGVLFCLALLNIEKGRYNKLSAPFKLVALCSLLCFIFVNQPTKIESAKGYTQYLSETEISLSNAVLDTHVWERVNYDIPRLIPLVRYLQINSLSVFDRRWRPWLGQNIGDHYRIDPASQCTGAVDSATGFPGAWFPGYRIEGWAWDAKAKARGETLLLTDEGGGILGAATGGFSRPDVPAIRADVTDQNVGWIGYCSQTKSKIMVYMIRPGNKGACLIGGREIKPFGFVGFERLGPEIERVSVVTGGSWVENGYYPNVGAPPLGGRAYGSWHGSDENTGALRLDFDATGGSDVALPVVMGPVADGISVRVIDVATGSKLEELKPDPSLAVWHAWHFRLPATKSQWRLEVIAEDDGNKWGEWLGIGFPRQVETN